MTVNYSAIAVDFAVVISTIDPTDEEAVLGSDQESKSQSFKRPSGTVTKSFEFDDLITKVQANSKYCLVLLESGDVYKIVISSFQKEKLNFISVEKPKPKPKSVFVMPRTSEEPERVTDVACGELICVAVTNYNSIYNIPNKTIQLERHEKVRKICCGAEHAMLLTENGDVYTWGNGLRGQLGHGSIQNEETPKLVENLAGIRVIDIAAGAFHSVAVSIYGDLYVWGWNS